jgi:purine-binding chemotaxis protein CheW
VLLFVALATRGAGAGQPCIIDRRNPEMKERIMNMPLKPSAGFSNQGGMGGRSTATKPSLAQSDGRQYLTLRLGGEEYAIDILRVQEIRSYEEPTRMVNAPPFIKGVINLRGVIVPIMDLRLKLNISKVEYTEFTVVIILNVRGTVVGAVVDAVSDVVTLTQQEIKAAPQFDTAIDSRFIVGLANLAERMLIVMNIEALMSDAEMGMVQSALPR